MSKYLVIVESPNKVKKIKSFLGKDFDVCASVGHIKDLPAKGLNVNIKKDFEPTYGVMPGKKSVIDIIKKKASKVNLVYIMTDEDREGEGIAFHISSILPKKTPYKRAITNSITKKAVQEAIDNAGDIDMEMVSSYETRRILDRLCGYRTSFLTQQATGGKSAGRVQSAALRILAEREKEIQSFIPQEYWPIDVDLERKNGERITASIKVPKPLDIKTGDKANAIIKVLKKEKWKVSKYETKEKSNRAYPPFTTSTMYQSASSILGWGSKKTAQVAQLLYEQGLCLLEDELITLSDGTIIPIKKANDYIGKKVKAFERMGDLSSLKINDSEIKDFQKLRYEGDIYSIRTLDGQEISVTPDHELLTFNYGQFKWTKSENIKEKDFIICAKNIPCERIERDIYIIDFIKLLPDKIKLKIMVFGGIKNRDKILKIIENNKNKISVSTYYKYKRNLKIPLMWILSSISNNISLFEEFDSYFQWQAAGSKKEKIDVQSLCYFIGLMLGDGHVCRNKSMITFPPCIASKKEWGKIAEGIVYEQKMNYDSCAVQFSGRILKELCKLFGGREGYKSDSIFIHPFISALPEKFLWSFLAGLFDSDGCLKTVKAHSDGSLKASLLYTSISQCMLKQMGVILKTLGISNSLHRRKNDSKNGSIKIWENSCYLFLSKIHSHLYIKGEDAKQILDGFNNKTLIYTGKSRNENYPVIDIIEKEREKQKITKQYLSQYIASNNSHYWAYTRVQKGHSRKSYISKDILLKLNEVLDIKEIKRIIDGDEYFSVVKEIKISKYDGYVYDISTSTENFIANSFYSHNCTYIRSDSTFIVPEFIDTMRGTIPVKYGNQYLPNKINIFSNKANAQEAHEAIRVTELGVESVSGLDANNLYHIIWKRTVASQVSNFVQFVGTADFKCKKYLFGASGSKVVFDGWRKVWDYGSMSDVTLPEFVIGEELKLIDVRTEQKFTTPPPRYT